MKVAVAAVAKELKCSETTIWNAWSGFDPLSTSGAGRKLRPTSSATYTTNAGGRRLLNHSRASLATRRNLLTKKSRSAPRSWKRSGSATKTINHYKYIATNL